MITLNIEIQTVLTVLFDFQCFYLSHCKSHVYPHLLLHKSLKICSAYRYLFKSSENSSFQSNIRHEQDKSKSVTNQASCILNESPQSIK